MGYPRAAVWITAAAVGFGGFGLAVVLAQAPQRLPLLPAKERGASVTPAFEGWYENDDGSFMLLVGYYNRNSRETLDIPVGPNNHVDPGGPDQGQPTFFESGREWGVFTIKVPKDFGAKALTWSITSNGEEQSIPLTLNKAYSVTPFHERGMGNSPPVLWFAEGGAKVTGPPVGVAASYTGAVNEPVAINVWASDEKGSTTEQTATSGRVGSTVSTLSFHKFRGPGQVTFDKARLPVTSQGGMVTSNAKFDTAGEYLVRVQANDESGEGGGGFQCCWTNTYVKVTVK